MFKPKLKSLDVPWEISPGVAFMEVIANETDSWSIKADVNFLDVENMHLKMSRIKITFDRFLWMSISWGERGFIDDIYDFSLVSIVDLRQATTQGEWDKILAESMILWRDTNICPFDTAYHVLDDPKAIEILKKYPDYAHIKYNHYLFAGREMYVEVLANKFDWVVLE